MRRLKQTVLAGGVVYPAGTPEDAIEGEVKRDDVWEDVDGDAVDDLGSKLEESDHPNTAALRELVEYLAELHLFNKDATVPELLGFAVEVFGSTSAAPDGTTEVFGDLPKGDGSEEGSPAPEPPAAPARPATKADWVAYATDPALGDNLSEQDAKAMTRDQLAEKYLGSDEDGNS